MLSEPFIPYLGLQAYKSSLEAVDYTIEDIRARPLFSAIKAAVCNHFRVSMADLTSERRTHKVAYARHVGIYVARVMTPRSYPIIARSFNRDHTTAIFAFQRISERIVYDDKVRKDVAAIIRAVEGVNGRLR